MPRTPHPRPSSSLTRASDEACCLPRAVRGVGERREGLLPRIFPFGCQGESNGRELVHKWVVDG